MYSNNFLANRYSWLSENGIFLNVKTLEALTGFVHSYPIRAACTALQISGHRH
jgi:hypothetical protein